jgi:putative transcriptional regulator
MDENEGSIPPVECLPGLFGGRDAGDSAGIKIQFGSTGVRCDIRTSATASGSLPKGRDGNGRHPRFEHGDMTQDQLGKVTGVTRHTIMALEAGKYLPSLLLAFRIAQAFRVHLEEVFEVKENGR